jgi:hypothetical protein
MCAVRSRRRMGSDDRVKLKNLGAMNNKGPHLLHLHGMPIGIALRIGGADAWHNRRVQACTTIGTHLLADGTARLSHQIVPCVPIPPFAPGSARSSSGQSRGLRTWTRLRAIHAVAGLRQGMRLRSDWFLPFQPATPAYAVPLLAITVRDHFDVDAAASKQHAQTTGDKQ